MELAVDIGNTTINLGFYQENVLKYKYVFDTSFDIDYFSIFKANIKDIKYDDVHNIIFSSVVPTISLIVKEALGKLMHGASIYEVSSDIDYGVKMNIDNPSEVGSDLVCDLVAAKAKYSSPLLVIDLGTATKYLYLDENSIFQSALIMPGLKLSTKSLFSKAELLPDVDLKTPTSLMDSKNTISCIKNGVIYGQLEMIKGLSNSYQKETAKKLTKIITGGDQNLFYQFLKDEDFIFDDSLVLDGALNILHMILERGN